MLTSAQYMQQAIRLAEKGKNTTTPNPCVGCVIVKNGKIVGKGWHQQAGQAHAEIMALQQAQQQAKNATVYVTLEPCNHTGKTPPCSEALIKAGVKQVVVAMLDPNPLVSGKGITKLEQAGIKVAIGLLEAQAMELNRGFIKRMVENRPFVRIKLAMSLDGRTAMASGESQWISGAASRYNVQQLRAQSCAVLTGIDTVLADNPSMNVRLPAAELGQTKATQVRQPKRIVLDSQLRMPKKAKIFQVDGDCWVYTTKKQQNKISTPYKIATVATNNDKIDLHDLMRLLAEKQINLLHVEAGSVLSGAFLSANLVDEIVIFMAPHIMGDGAKGLFHLPAILKMEHRVKLKITDVRFVGEDIRIIAQPSYMS